MEDHLPKLLSLHIFIYSILLVVKSSKISESMWMMESTGDGMVGGE